MTATPTKSITVTHDRAAPPAKVWRALTDSQLVAAWLMPNDLKPIVGHRFTFNSQPMGNWDGVVHCEVTIVEPTTRLAYAWVGGSDVPERGITKLNTVVTWTLTPTVAGGTRLHLDHSGFTESNGFAFDAMTKGWSE